MNTFIKMMAATTALVALAGTAQAQSNGLGSGTFTTSGSAAANITGTANGTTTDTFLIRGTVPLDCSFFTGGRSTTINLGNIGIVNSSNVAVGNAFDMAGPAVGQAQTSTAGCNFNNTVTITKTNGADGLLNGDFSGFDSTQFQKNLPYQLTASFNATNNTESGANGTAQQLVVAPNATGNNANYGAWRSQFTLDVLVPVPELALVAGEYEDTVTVTFATF
jgi:hypothetical protein